MLASKKIAQGETWQQIEEQHPDSTRSSLSFWQGISAYLATMHGAAAMLNSSQGSRFLSFDYALALPAFKAFSLSMGLEEKLKAAQHVSGISTSSMLLLNIWNANSDQDIWESTAKKVSNHASHVGVAASLANIAAEQSGFKPAALVLGPLSTACGLLSLYLNWADNKSKENVELTKKIEELKNYQEYRFSKLIKEFKNTEVEGAIDAAWDASLQNLSGCKDCEQLWDAALYFCVACRLFEKNLQISHEDVEALDALVGSCHQLMKKEHEEKKLQYEKIMSFEQYLDASDTELEQEGKRLEAASGSHEWRAGANLLKRSNIHEARALIAEEKKKIAWLDVKEGAANNQEWLHHARSVTNPLHVDQMKRRISLSLEEPPLFEVLRI
jgi:hypothetical protein